MPRLVHTKWKSQVVVALLSALSAYVDRLGSHSRGRQRHSNHMVGRNQDKIEYSYVI